MNTSNFNRGAGIVVAHMRQALLTLISCPQHLLWSSRTELRNSADLSSGMPAQHQGNETNQQVVARGSLNDRRAKSRRHSLHIEILCRPPARIVVTKVT